MRFFAIALSMLLGGTLLAGSPGTAAAADPPPVPPLNARSPLPFREDTPDQFLPPDTGSPARSLTRSLPAADGPFPQYKAYRDLQEVELTPPGDRGRTAPFCTRHAG